jgi:hypothetical protein
MVDNARKSSSGRPAEQSPGPGSSLEGKQERDEAAAGDKPLQERTFEDHFGETAELQDRRVFDKTVVVERDGTTVLTDSPREGDLPLGVAQLLKAQEQVASQEKAARRSDG